MKAMKRKVVGWILAVVIGLGILGYVGYRYWLSPTRILVVNTLKTQEADFILSNDSKKIRGECVEADKMGRLDGYDAIILFARRLYLNEEQLAEVDRAAERGVPVFTKTVKSSSFAINKNLTDEQRSLLQQYFDNENRQNFRNGLRYLRHLSTPYRWGDQDFEAPVEMQKNIYYHREYGKYFQKAAELTDYLKKKRLYHEGGHTIALISGIQFPMEGNRQHVDTLITLLTHRGMNVYPMTCTGKKREKMLKELMPDAIVYMSMGRLGNDTLISWLQEKNILLFTPYPISLTHAEWMDARHPMSSGTKNSRIVIPEIDGGVAPFCIGTQNQDKKGYFVHTAEAERCSMFVSCVEKYLTLRTKKNSEKRIAIGYFKRPGKDALLASGMEVIPSLYHFLKRLRDEGYDVSGLPTSEEAFARDIKTEGIVLGSYAKGAQERYMREGHPVWLTKNVYEKWAHEVITPTKYAEVVERYGEAPGSLLAKGDSLAVACVRYGNILLFPQPRPAIGDDDFKLVHGVEVAPPHSYLAPYLYVQKGFQADALIHFGTHGNLEFTPGRDTGMRREDWSAALVGDLPHFYYYTTGNVGESIIAKRRSHAVLLTYLTPPYVPSGMRQKYATLLSDIHRAVKSGGKNRSLILAIKKTVVEEGLNRELNLDDRLTQPYSLEELEQLDAHVEELSNEKMQGAYYTLGQTYSERDLQNTTLAICADPLAYDMARNDRDEGKISSKQLQDYAFVAHHYLPRARQQIVSQMGTNPYRQMLITSTREELNRMIRALNGGTVAPAPGGDPVLNPNVLPTGRNMYSINPDNTPDIQAWEDGKKLAESTLERYRRQHDGEWPHKVSYTFWAGEFINTQGATIAQALWMLGVEPIRDAEGRINDLRLIPRKELRRPRINVVVQVSGQLRDIAGSRLKLITDAVKLASSEKEDSNFVSEGTILQEKELMKKGMAPKRARELSTIRVFGPVNSGYSTGMMNYIERSGTWEKSSELVDGYLNNMGAAYGDEQNWGDFVPDLFASALQQTDVVVQPRQSNTWGPVSLDHVYEFTGGLSLAVKTLTGKEPDAYFADYRNRSNRRMQDVKEAVAVEMRTSLLNPVYIRERMKGDEGTAQMFGEMFRNLFGWSATRPNAVDKEIYNDLYRLYVVDVQQLGIRNYFQRVNPAAYQAMTSVMIESARKGFWKPSAEQLKELARLHAEITKERGAACTDFVCNNEKLQTFVSKQLDGKLRTDYQHSMDAVKMSGSGQKDMVLKEQNQRQTMWKRPHVVNGIVVGMVVVLGLVVLVVWLRRKK